MNSKIRENLDENDRSNLFEYLYGSGDTPSWLYEYYMEEMPYGTQKARTGDPDNWLADRVERIEEDFSTELQIERDKRVMERLSTQRTSP